MKLLLSVLLLLLLTNSGLFKEGLNAQEKKIPAADKLAFSGSFVKISDRNPSFFELSDGKPFIVNGPCLAGAPDMNTMKTWLMKISENKGNFARVWLSSPLFEIEQKQGIYDESKLRNIDSLIIWATRFNIKLKLCIEHFRQIVPDPKASFNKPQYHIENGGTFHNMDEYINSDQGKQLYLKKIKLFKERYGNQPAVFGWELWNEMNGIMCPGLWEWNEIMLPEVHKIFPENLVLQSLGSFDMEGRRKDYRHINTLTSNDVAQIHRYIDAGARLDICMAPMDLLSADAIDELRSYQIRKPMLLAEAGAVLPNHTGPSDLYPADTAGILLHDMLFAPFFSGAAGTGNSWHWDKYIDRNNLWYHFSRFDEAVKGINPPEEDFLPLKIFRYGLRIYILAGKKTIMVWCRDAENDWNRELVEGKAPGLISGAEIDLGSLISTSLIGEIRIYDPWKNQWMKAQKKSRITLPEFRRSLVIRIEKM